MVQAGASYVVVILWLVLGWRSMQQGGPDLAAKSKSGRGAAASEEAASEFFSIVLLRPIGDSPMLQTRMADDH
jgi:hypothetical protein